MVWLPSVIIISFLVWADGPEQFPITFQVNDFARRRVARPLYARPDRAAHPKALAAGTEPARGRGHRGERDSASEGEAGSDRIPDKAEPETAGA
jgi:hypothetical protein